MNKKFQRSYVLRVETEDGGTVEVTDPYTLEFNVVRAMMASSQNGTFRLLNLNPVTRDRIFKDRNTIRKDGTLRSVKLWAGYGSFRPLVFNGSILEATSHREGVDFITTIQANDNLTLGASTSNIVFSGPKTYKELVQALAKDLKGVTAEPIIGDFPTARQTSKGVVLSGNTWGLINTYTEGRATLDNGQLKVLFDKQAIIGGIPVLTAESGLLGTPVRGNARMEVPMLFEPRLTLGQKILLESEWQAVNRVYQVAGFTHKGTISAAVGGDCRSDIILYGPSQFQVINGEAVMQ